jgi:prevent-host-death family protein
MIQSWQLQDAKNKFSKVIDDAIHEGPQLITRRGAEVAIVLSYAEYQRMVAAKPPLSDFFQNSPLAGEELDLSRDQSGLREEFGL